MEKDDQLFGVDFHGLSTEDEEHFVDNCQSRPITPEILRPVASPYSNGDSELFKDLKSSSGANQQDWRQNLMLRSLSSEYIQRYSSIGDPERQFSFGSSDSHQNYKVRTVPRTKSANRMGNNSPLPSISSQIVGNSQPATSDYGFEEKKFSRPLTPMDIKVDLWPQQPSTPTTTSRPETSPKGDKISQNSLQDDARNGEERVHREEKKRKEEQSPQQQSSPQEAINKTPPSSSTTPERLMGYDELIAGLDQDLAHHLHRIESMHADRRLAISHSRTEHYHNLLSQHKPAKIAFITYQQVLDQWETATARIENVADGLCIIVVLPYLRLVKVEVRPVLTVQEKLQRIGMELWQVGTDYWQTLQVASTIQQPAVKPDAAGKNSKKAADDSNSGGTWSSWVSNLLTPAVAATDAAHGAQDTSIVTESSKKKRLLKHSVAATDINEKLPRSKRNPNKCNVNNSNNDDSDCDSMAGNVDDAKLRNEDKRSPPKTLSLSFIPPSNDNDNISDHYPDNDSSSPQVSPSSFMRDNIPSSKKKGFNSPKIVDSSRSSPKGRKPLGLQESVYYSQYDMTSSMASITAFPPANEEQLATSPEQNERLSKCEKSIERSISPKRSDSRSSRSKSSRPLSSSSQQQLSSPFDADRYQYQVSRSPSEMLASSPEEEKEEEEEYLDLDDNKRCIKKLSKKKKTTRKLPPLSPSKPVFTTSSSGRVSVRIEAHRTNRKYDPYANYENTQYCGDFEIQLDSGGAALPAAGIVQALVTNDSLAHRYNKQTGLLVVYVNQLQLTPDSEHLKHSTAAASEGRDNSSNLRTTSFGSVFSASSFYASRSNANSSPSSPRTTTTAATAGSGRSFKLPPLMLPWTQSLDSLNNHHQNRSDSSNNSDTSKDDDNNATINSSNRKSRARSALEENTSPESSSKHLPHLAAALASSKEVFEI